MNELKNAGVSVQIEFFFGNDQRSKMSIKTIIVDDVELARERVKMLLDDAEIEIIAECENGREAIETIRNLKPDLVFLDIEMPKINGFEVIETVGAGKMPTVIFVTAYDEFALRAFEVNAIDYLLKPFDEERLRKAVLRAKRQIAKQESAAEIEEKLRRLLQEVKPSRIISSVFRSNRHAARRWF
jgi:two-component system LytT family response regulator